MAKLFVMGMEGHKKPELEWDPVAVEAGDPEALVIIQQAEEILRDAERKGAFAFEVDPVTRETHRIEKINPMAQEIFIGLPLAGG